MFGCFFKSNLDLDQDVPKLLRLPLGIQVKIKKIHYSTVFVTGENTPKSRITRRGNVLKLKNQKLVRLTVCKPLIKPKKS